MAHVFRMTSLFKCDLKPEFNISLKPDWTFLLTHKEIVHLCIGQILQQIWLAMIKVLPHYTCSFILLITFGNSTPESLQIAPHWPRLCLSLLLPQLRSCASTLSFVLLFALGPSFYKIKARGPKGPNMYKYSHEHALFINAACQDTLLVGKHFLETHFEEFSKTNKGFTTFHSTLKIFCWHLLCCVSPHLTVTLQAVWWKGRNQLKLRGKKNAEIWCGESQQLRKFLFFWDQREL